MTDTDEVMQHKETSVKVNAWVDRGVAPLVQALNEFPQVYTLQSCEGPAEVTFTYGTEDGLPWAESVKFALWLANEFAERREEATCVTLTCQRRFRFHIRLQVEPDAVARVAAELRAMAYRFTETGPRDRMADFCLGGVAD